MDQFDPQDDNDFDPLSDDDSTVPVALIAARARNGCIGRNGKLPWKLPGDLPYFRRCTWGKPVIMGRKTWESLPGPLAGRTNIVVTRQSDYAASGAKVVGSLEAGIGLAQSVALIEAATEIMVMGGGEIYAQALVFADRLYLTEVHDDIKGDAFFPAVDLSDYKQLAREDFYAAGDNPYDFSFVRYQRTNLTR